MLEFEGEVIWIEGFPVAPAAGPDNSDLEGFEVDVINETFDPSKPSK